MNARKQSSQYFSNNTRKRRYSESRREGKIKTAEEIAVLRKGGEINAVIVNELSKLVKPGLDTRELDKIARQLAREHAAEPSFLGYRPKGVKNPYPSAVCVSVNEVVVHGIPGEPVYELQSGDIVTVDMGLLYNGMYTDHAVTVGVGKISRESETLIAATEQSLLEGIAAALPGNHLGDIGHAIETYAREVKLSIANDLCGHGVGYAVHEDPYVLNWGKPGEGEELQPGMVLAIEPMLMLGKSTVEFMDDEYTVVTKDRKRSAHFEHTVVITENGVDILTLHT